MNESSTGHARQIIAALVVLVLIAAVITGVAFAGKKDDTSAPQTSSQTTTTPASTATTTSTSYKDGTYTAAGSFGTPGGANTIHLTLTIANGVVGSTTATADSPDHESEGYDNRFLSSYQQFVVGKSLNQISVSRVAGASLTTQGFRDALQKIADQAQA